MRSVSEDPPEYKTRALAGAHDVGKHPFGTYERLNDVLCELCAASGWSIWPEQMQQRKLWEVRAFYRHRGQRIKELNKANKGSTAPQYPDWIL